MIPIERNNDSNSTLDISGFKVRHTRNSTNRSISDSDGMNAKPYITNGSFKKNLLKNESFNNNRAPLLIDSINFNNEDDDDNDSEARTDRESSNSNRNNGQSLSRSKLTLTGSKSKKHSSRNYILGDSDDEFSSDYGLILDTKKESDFHNKFTSDISLDHDNDPLNKQGDSFFTVQDEYIPDLDYKDIIRNWQQEEFEEQNKTLEEKEDDISNSKNFKTSSYSNLFKRLHQQNRQSSLALSKYPTWESTDEETEESSIANDDYGFDSADQDDLTNTQNIQSPNTSMTYKSSHAQVEPIPLPNLRTLMTPPSALEMERRVSYSNINQINDSSLMNYKSSISPLKLRTLPSTSALTNQLSSLRRKTSLPVPQNKLSLDEASLSLPLSHLPISCGPNVQIKKQDIEELIRLLPNDFLSLPYSQRKKKILEYIPMEKIHHYKLIMSLVKKFMLNSSRSNISLLNDNVTNNKSVSSNDDLHLHSVTNTNSVTKNTNIQNPRHTRHNSVASQFLSSFSPSIASLPNMLQNDPSQCQAKFSNNNSVVTTISKPEDKGMQIFDHTLGKIIGFGAWGTIRECYSNKTGECRAIKIVRFKNNKKVKSQVVREVTNWNKLSHSFILPLFDYKLDDNYAMYSLTKIIDHGTLYDLVISWDVIANTKISHERRCRYTVQLTYQVIQALNYMHSKCILHGDIKLENCLLEESDNEKCKWKVYVCDFGMSHNLKEEDPNTPESPSNIGSLPYASPELLSENKISYESDIWAFGVMLYTMLLGKLPFKHGSESKLRELIQSGYFDVEALQFLNGVKQHATLKDIICGCLEVDVSKRWSIQKIKQVLEEQL